MSEQKRYRMKQGTFTDKQRRFWKAPCVVVSDEDLAKRYPDQFESLSEVAEKAADVFEEQTVPPVQGLEAENIGPNQWNVINIRSKKVINGQPLTKEEAENLIGAPLDEPEPADVEEEQEEEPAPKPKKRGTKKKAAKRKAASKRKATRKRG